jgi:tRNA nucleotidyltransferase (CCA-adding enzyme)
MAGPGRTLAGMIPFELTADALPAPVHTLLGRLRAEGFAAHLVGGCVRDLARGHQVRDFDVTTPAPPEAVLALFPRAVPTGLRHGTVMVPTGAGPIDVTHYRAGPKLEDDLACRDFTLNAVAWDPASGALIDPFDGLADLRAGRLRCVGSAAARLGEDPARALRAARFLACLLVEPDAELIAAMAHVSARLRDVKPERLRREIEPLLLGARAGDGLQLLRRTGLEARIAPETQEDAPAVVDALPQDLELRLAGWLRGTRAGKILSRLRFPRRVVRRVERLLLRHPVHAHADPTRDASLRRFLGKMGDEDTEALLELRQAELEVATQAPPEERERLAALREGFERVRRSGALALQRSDLALDGAAVMEILGTGPGRSVGRALRALTDAVLEDPTRNTPEALRDLLVVWWSHEQEPGEGI